MSPTPKGNREEVAREAADKKGVGEHFTAVYENGVHRLAEIQKRALDLAVEQNNEFTDAWKKVVQKIPGAPGLFWLDLASGAFERFGETGKDAIDVMLEQSHALLGMTRDQNAATAKAAEKGVNFVQQSVERSVASQKKVWDNVAAHTKKTFDTLRQQSGIAGGPADAAVKSIHRSVDAVIEAQKDLLDMAAVH